jgi:hypothetical protein
MRESGSKTALANGINKTVGWPPGRMPIVPDRTMVMTEAAREPLDGILVAAWYDKRFGDLGAAAASVLAMLLRLYAHEGRPPSAKEIAATTGITELETARLLTALSQHDLVILERDGTTIRGAYPFTQSATGRSALVPCAARIL